MTRLPALACAPGAVPAWGHGAGGVAKDGYGHGVNAIPIPGAVEPMVEIPACTARTKKGLACAGKPVGELDVCMAHMPKE